MKIEKLTFQIKRGGLPGNSPFFNFQFSIFNFQFSIPFPSLQLVVGLRLCVPAVNNAEMRKSQIENQLAGRYTSVRACGDRQPISKQPEIGVSPRRREGRRDAPRQLWALRPGTPGRAYRRG
jgi:hypothetical protein